MYLCGYSTEQILEKQLPKKLLENGVDLTFHLAIYAMLEFKGNESAMLVHGHTVNDANPRAWVEYKDAKEKRMVRDYSSSWINMTETAFHNKLFPDTERLYLDYIFWEKYEEHLYDLIQKPETSYVLGGINLICPKIKNGRFYGFTNFNRHNIDIITGIDFNPLVIKNPDGTFSLLTRELIDSLMQ